MASSKTFKQICRYLNSAVSSILTTRTIVAIILTITFIATLITFTRLLSTPDSERVAVDAACGRYTSATTGATAHLTQTRSLRLGYNQLSTRSHIEPFDAIASATAGSPLASLYQCTTQPAQSVVRIAVITSISAQPTKAMIQMASLDEVWCIIVIGDTNGPTQQMFNAAASSRNTSRTNPSFLSRIIYFDIAEQSRLPYRIISVIPENSFTRKNIGYLIAIHAGAHVIFDLDDDNVYTPKLSPTGTNGIPFDLKPSAMYISPQHHVLVTDEEINSEESERVLSYNPYPDFGAVRAWPRGFPLSHVKRSLSAADDNSPLSSRSTCTAVVQQILTNVHPDVDAIYRMTNDGVPFNFASTESVHSEPIAVPDGAYTPYNAQATIHLAQVFPLLILPTTVHGRVSDIWRSYVAQTVMTYGYNTSDGASQCLRSSPPPCIVFTPPYITHQRNLHNDKRDYNSERPLYDQTEALLAWLTQRRHGAVYDIRQRYSLPPLSSSFVDILLLLYDQLYSVGVLDAHDVTVVELWRSDLSRMPLRATKETTHCDGR